MNKSILVIFILAFSGNAYSLNTFIANYKLSINDLTVATETRALEKFVEQYVYTAKAKTIGFAKLLGDISIEAKSMFMINSTGVNSQKYIMNEKRDKTVTKSYSLNFSSEDKIVISEPTISNPDTTTFESEDGNILDPLSLFMALSNDLEKYPNKIHFSYQVADGKSLKNKKYIKTSVKSFMINNKIENVIMIEQADSKNGMWAYFSPKHQFLPVLIEKTKGESIHRYALTGLKVELENSQTLQVIF